MLPLLAATAISLSTVNQTGGITQGVVDIASGSYLAAGTVLEPAVGFWSTEPAPTPWLEISADSPPRVLLDQTAVGIIQHGRFVAYRDVTLAGRDRRAIDEAIARWRREDRRP